MFWPIPNYAKMKTWSTWELETRKGWWKQASFNLKTAWCLDALVLWLLAMLHMSLFLYFAICFSFCVVLEISCVTVIEYINAPLFHECWASISNYQKKKFQFILSLPQFKELIKKWRSVKGIYRKKKIIIKIYYLSPCWLNLLFPFYISLTILIIATLETSSSKTLTIQLGTEH